MTFLISKLMAILACLAVTLAGWAVGALFDGGIPRTLTGILRIAIRLALGLGAFGLLLFIIGLIRFTPALVIALTLAGAMVGAILLFRERPDAAICWRHLRQPALFITLLIVAFFFFSGLSPIIGGVGNDGTDYHLLGPQVWLRAGIVRPVLDNAFTSMPAGIDILYAPLLAIGKESAPGAFGAVFLVIVLALIWGMARRFGANLNATSCGVLTFATSFALVKGTNLAFNDIPLAALIVSAVCVALAATRLKEFAVAGLLLGFAIGAKYHALLLAPGFIVVVLWMPEHPLPLRLRLTAVVVLGLCTVAVASPWYLRNWAALGSPIYPAPPALAKWFPGRYLSLADLRALDAYMHMHADGFGKTPLALAAMPLNITFRPERFDAGDGIALGFLAFCPIGLIVAVRDSRLLRLAILLFLCLLTWFYTAQQARYFTYGFALLAVFAAVGIEKIFAFKSGSAAVGTLGVLTVSTLYGALSLLRLDAARLRAAFSPRSAEQQWVAQTPYARAFDFLNGDASVSSVLVLNPMLPTFFLHRPYLKPVGPHGERAMAAIGVRDDADALARAKDLGVSHILDSQWPSRNPPPHVDIVGDPYPFLIGPQDHLTLVFQSPDARVYELPR